MANISHFTQTVNGVSTTYDIHDANAVHLDANSIAFHNAYPRCKYLGTSITDAQNTAIKNRTYDDLFIGDYWTIKVILILTKVI